MKAVLMSIQPKWCEKIANGKKTIEVRKTKPNLKTPFKVYIYCTNTPKYHHLYDLRPYNNGKIVLGCVQHNSQSLVADNYINGKVIGEFVCDKVENIFSQSRFWLNEDTLKSSCLSAEQIWDYANGAEKIYGWRITDLKIYDKPKELGEFYKECKDVKDFPNSCRRKSCDHYYEEWQNCYAECCFNGERPLERPPQSWCYVEELQNG